jgi:DNA-directed RNA polymerase specialized sigma24 family protein
VNEPALIAACCRGHRIALEFLTLHYWGVVRAAVKGVWARARRKSCELRDLEQEVYVKILKGAGECLTCNHDEVRNLDAWLTTIARNAALDTLKSSRCPTRRNCVHNSLRNR